MPRRHGNGRWVVGVLVVAVVAGGVWSWTRGRSRKARVPAVVVNGKSPLPVLTERLRSGDAKALTVLFERVMEKGLEAPPPVAEEEAAAWLEVLGGLRAGYPKFAPVGRASVLTVAAKVFERFSVDPAPVDWRYTLPPIHDLLASGLNDPSADVRLAALEAMKKVWGWLPGRTMEEVEENTLAKWKEYLYDPTVQRLADPEAKVRAGAVACLGVLPINSAASPAAAYVSDADPSVRLQTLTSFGDRTELLTEEAILPLLYDPAPEVARTAEIVLRKRGLTQEHLGLCRLLAHPQADLRASAIPLVLARDDIDPVVWLIYLSRDREESVRLKALAALVERKEPEAQRRVAEMAAGDSSAAVRKLAARRFSLDPTTASLPPLPGSPGLNPKAN